MGGRVAYKRTSTGQGFDNFKGPLTVENCHSMWMNVSIAEANNHCLVVVRSVLHGLDGILDGVDRMHAPPQGFRCLSDIVKGCVQA